MTQVTEISNPTLDPNTILANNQPVRYIDLDIDQLTALTEDPTPASGYSLEGLEEHPGFSKIFTHRSNPLAIIQILLKELSKQHKATEKAAKKALPPEPTTPKPVTTSMLEVKKFEAAQTEKFLTLKNEQLEKRLLAAEHERDLKHEMLSVRRIEAEAKLQRGESLTVFQNRILSKLQTVEKKLDYLLTQMATTNQE